MLVTASSMSQARGNVPALLLWSCNFQCCALTFRLKCCADMSAVAAQYGQEPPQEQQQQYAQQVEYAQHQVPEQQQVPDPGEVQMAFQPPPEADQSQEAMPQHELQQPEPEAAAA